MTPFFALSPPPPFFFFFLDLDHEFSQLRNGLFTYSTHYKFLTKVCTNTTTLKYDKEKKRSKREPRVKRERLQRITKKETKKKSSKQEKRKRWYSLCLP